MAHSPAPRPSLSGEDDSRRSLPHWYPLAIEGMPIGPSLEETNVADSFERRPPVEAGEDNMPFGQIRWIRARRCHLRSSWHSALAGGRRPCETYPVRHRLTANNDPVHRGWRGRRDRIQPPSSVNLVPGTVPAILQDIDRNLTEHYSIDIPERVQQQHGSWGLLPDTTSGPQRCFVCDSPGGSICIPMFRDACISTGIR
jgi:hypothetical protein